MRGNRLSPNGQGTEVCSGDRCEFDGVIGYDVVKEELARVVNTQMNRGWRRVRDGGSVRTLRRARTVFR